VLHLPWSEKGFPHHEIQHKKFGTNIGNSMGTGDAGDGCGHLVWGNYGQRFLETMSSIYPGYQATRNIADVVVGTLYGIVDGFIGGAVFAWLYNRFARRSA